MKAQLPVTGDADDFIIDEQYIPAARRIVEKRAGRSLMTQTRRQTHRRFPPRIYMRFGPVQSVSSITYVDDAGATQTLATTEYTLYNDTVEAVIEEAFNKTWPTALDQQESVKVTAVHGYASRALVPMPYREAIVMIAVEFWWNRGICALGKDFMANLDALLSTEGRTVGVG